MSAHGTDNHHHGHNETINFSGPGYYGSVSGEPYGFNFADNVEYVNASYWENIQTDWCDNGYTNVTAASKGAIGCAYIYEDGLMESGYLKEAFTLKSMIAASAWDTNAVWDIKSYTYANGSLSLKASDSVTLSQTAQKIDFAKLGAKGDFKNISAVFFELSNAGSAGNTCSYGSPTYGVQLIIDHVKVHWNGKIPTGNHKTVLPPGLASHHHLSPHARAQHQHAANHADAGAAIHSTPHHSDAGYHSQLLSLTGHDPGGLTTQFHLPVVEHFGS